MTDAIRWGILGAGGIAGTVGAEIAATPDHQVVAVGARDLDRAAALADQLGGARSYGSYAELVADPDLDVVYIATTHGQHHEQALLCLGAGKPILVEKAFTLNARQAREVIAEARQRQLFCMEAMWMRLNPLIRTAQDAAASGRIGDLVSVRSELSTRFEFDPTHRLFDLHVGGGALLDIGVYAATFAWLFLGRPDTVQVTGSLSPTGSDATVAMQWGYADGRFAQIASTTLSASPLSGLVVGTKGWISVDGPMARPASITIHDADGDEVLTDPLTGAGYQPEVLEVAHCLRAGQLESPLVPLDETLAILEVFDDVRARLGVRYPADQE
ncbi:MAG TPA: Gfo/Idh/MocA family oxidoreductase [Jatrophihabitantaceae bacterium]|jgi:predicted dehydrogenase